MKINEIIFEGGNAFAGKIETVRIPRAQVRPTVSFLEKITGLPLLNNMLGSTGIKIDSGDLDLAVDAKKHSKEELLEKLTAWIKKNDPKLPIRKTGISVHFACPILGKVNNPAVQVDFMFLNDIDFAKWIMRLDSNSQYKNVARTILIASIAKFLGYKFSYLHGLLNRETQQPIKNGTNPDAIAKRILNPNATADDLISVESILSALATDPKREEKLSDAIETLPRYGISMNVLK